MGKGFWSDIGFSLDRAFCPETLGFMALHILFAIAGYVLFTIAGPLPSGPALRALEPERVLELAGGIVAIGLGLLLAALPAWIFLLSRLFGRVFGQPLPVDPIIGALRALKAMIMVVLAGLLVAGLPALAVVFIGKLLHTPSGARGLVLVLLGLWLAWLGLIHGLYQFGVLYHGRFSFEEARALTRGRRGALAGGSFVLILIATLVSAIGGIIVPLTQASPMLQIAVSSLQTGAIVPLYIFLGGHFFLATGTGDRWTPTGAGLFFDAPPPSRGL